MLPLQSPHLVPHSHYPQDLLPLLMLLQLHLPVQVFYTKPPYRPLLHPQLHPLTKSKIQGKVHSTMAILNQRLAMPIMVPYQ